jgi:tRNA threonylcarbamoyladenosine biosynthesis protein TsaB
MALILHIETAEKICSVALSDGEKVLGIKESMGDRAHASLLTVLIDQLLKSANITFKQLNAISVSKGPGSYTGLRIGVSTAKGICYALNIPLIGVNTLQALANGFIDSSKMSVIKNESKQPYLLCPMIDARRMEVYIAIYDNSLREVEPVKAEIIHSGSFNHLPSDANIILFGSGASKCINVINNSNVTVVENILPRADFLIEPAYKAYVEGKFENLAYFEPFYLKDFVATTPKIKTGQ